MPHADELRRKEYKAQWYLKNKKRHNAKAAIWRAENKERKAELDRRYNEETIKGSPENKIRSLVRKARHRAKRAGIEFCITEKDLACNLFCPLLGVEICYSNNGMMPNSPSIDRLDPTKGYIPGNVWIISMRANRIKSDATVDELSTIVANLRKAQGN